MLRKSLAPDTLLGSTAPPHNFSMAVVNDNTLHGNHHEVEGNHSHHHTKEVADGGPWFQYVSSISDTTVCDTIYLYMCVYNTYIYKLGPLRFPWFQGQGNRTLAPTSSHCHATEREQHQFAALQRPGFETFDNPPMFYFLTSPPKKIFNISQCPESP